MVDHFNFRSRLKLILVFISFSANVFSFYLFIVLTIILVLILITVNENITGWTPTVLGSTLQTVDPLLPQGVSSSNPSKALTVFIQLKMQMIISVDRVPKMNDQSINNFITCHSTEAHATMSLSQTEKECLKSVLENVNGWSSPTAQWNRREFQSLDLLLSDNKHKHRSFSVLRLGSRPWILFFHPLRYFVSIQTRPLRKFPTTAQHSIVSCWGGLSRDISTEVILQHPTHHLSITPSRSRVP